MNIPVNFYVRAITYNKLSENLGDWLIKRNLVDTVTYNWDTGILSFINENDAIAFSLTFGIPPHQTTLDKKLAEATDA